MSPAVNADLGIRRIQKMLFLFGICLITFMHFFNTRTNVSSEPGIAMSVYSRYNAVIRLDGDDKVVPIPAQQYREYLDAEVSAAQVWRRKCAGVLADDGIRCYLTNDLESDSRIKHFKSYLLPSVLSGLVFDSETIASMQSKSNSITPTEQSKNTYDKLFESGVIFFNTLLWVKVGIFYVMCFKLRQVTTSRVFFLIFMIHSILSIAMDKVFSRGSGTYAIDKVIFGSPTFRNEVSLIQASVSALVDAAKATIGPGPGVVIWGITPRSFVIFIALAIFLPIFLERNWQLIWLTPIGFGVHATNFIVLYLFFIAIVLLAGCLPKRQDVPAIVWSTSSIILYSIFQFQTRVFSFWLILFASIILLLISFLFSSRNDLDTDDIATSLKRVLISTHTIFYFVAISTIGYYATKYRVPKSDGFWIDGFTRELAGRLAPAVTCITISFLVIACSQKFVPIAKFVDPQISLPKKDWGNRRIYFMNVTSLTIFFAVIYIATRSLFI